MLLAIDIGNTHTVLGLFAGDELRHSFRLQTDSKRTVDEYALEVVALLQLSKIDVKAIERVIIACVVPALTRVFTKLSQKYLGKLPHVVSARSRTDMEIRIDSPDTVGADRIVNAVAAKKRYGAPCVVVDFGTATTFDVVSKEGAYEGGIIAPGLMISAEALFSRAALLPNIELAKPKSLIGKNTRDAMLSGIVIGYVSLVDGIIERLKGEVGQDLKIVATGGLATMVAQESKTVQTVASDLTLLGLKDLAELNA